MFVRDILRQKGADVFAIAPEATLTQAAQEMMRHCCGSLVVMRGGELMGIITERDLLRVAATSRCLGDVRVDEGMTRDVITGFPDNDMCEVMSLLTARRIRHLPIMEGSTLVGLISIGDAVKYRSDALQFENHVLRSYIAS